MNRNITYVTLVILFLLLFPTAIGSELFYLRGNSETEEVDSVEYYELSLTAPNATSQLTTISKTTLEGVNELESWFTELGTSDYSVSNSAYLYFSSIGISGDTGKYRWTVYDYNPDTASSTLVVQSDWYTLPTTPSPHETFVNFPSHTFVTGHGAKLILEYDADSGGGTITAILDEGSSGNSVQYDSSSGSSYTVNYVSNAAFFLVNSTGSCTIACTSNISCDDSNSSTTDTCSNAGGCNSICLNTNPDVEITCSSNSNCDDSNSLTTDTCSNAGTENSSCTNTACSIACANDAGCDDSDATTIDTCSNAGTCNASCTFEAITQNNEPSDDEIICDSDSDCDDDLDTTTDACVNSGTTSSYCENVQCGIACSNNDSCDDGDTLTTNHCANPNTCEAQCLFNSCNPICTTNSDCGDDDTETTDICAGAGRCSAVCKNLPDVGNGICDPGETECSASADCGACGGSISDIYELACIGNSCKTTIKLGVCGNSRCESGENYFSCSEDCKPQNIIIDASFPDTFYVRGEKVHAKATITADGEKVKDAKIRVEGFFGNIPIHNNGKHDDGTRNDNVYANYFTISEDAKENLYPVTFIVEFGGVTQKKVAFLNLVPKLTFSVNFEKEFYVLGDNIKFNGNINLKEKPMQLPLDINIFAGNQLIKSQNLVSENGQFASNYRTTLIDQDGDYLILIKAFDANNNVGLFEKNVSVLNPEATDFLIVKTVDTNQNTYKKGSTAEITVIVEDILGSTVQKAVVKGETSTGITFELKQNEKGNYFGEFVIPNQTNSGEMSISVKATKQNKQGSVETTVNVTESKIIVEILEPKKESFLAGEEIRVKAGVVYENGQPLTTESIYAVVGNETVELKGTGKGTYEGTFIVKTTDEGQISIKINLNDGFDNIAEEAISVEVAGISYLYYLRLYGTSIFLFIIAAIITAMFGYRIAKKLLGVEALKDKEKQLLETIKGVQTQYFIEGTMDKKVYDKEMEKYETKLQEIRETIKEMSLERKK